MTRAHTRMALRGQLAGRGPWTRHGILAPAHARALISDGTPWVVHWCGGASVSSADHDADRALAAISRYHPFVDPPEYDRLTERQRRKGNGPTVIFAERWTAADGTDVIVFVEDAPHGWVGRQDPFSAW